MSRATVFGPGSTNSFTKFGSLMKPSDPIPQRLRDLARLESQKHVKRDLLRERRYGFCKKCGNTSVLVGFDSTPSARIGLWGRCRDDKDYTHHDFMSVSQAEYERLRDMPVDRRLNYWAFER